MLRDAPKKAELTSWRSLAVMATSFSTILLTRSREHFGSARASLSSANICGSGGRSRREPTRLMSMRLSRTSANEVECEMLARRDSGLQGLERNWWGTEPERREEF